MRIEILDRAQSDLLDGFHFYEAREAGLGSYFLTNLYADIESLRIHAGVPGRRETGNAETLKAEHLAVRTTEEGPRDQMTKGRISVHWWFL